MKYILLLVLLSSIAFGAEDNGLTKFVSKKKVYVPSKLGKLRVAQAPEGFSIVKDGVVSNVRYHNTNDLLRIVHKNGCLDEFLESGSIFVSQDNSGDYILRAQGKIKGAGPILAFVGYWGVKIVGYGVPVALATGTVAATGGAIVGAMAPVASATAAAAAAGGGVAAGGVVAGGTVVAAGVTTPVIATATATMAGTTVATGGVIAAGGQAVVATVGTAAATTATGAAFAASGCSAAGYIGAVEGTASVVGAALMAIPFI